MYGLTILAQTTTYTSGYEQTVSQTQFVSRCLQYMWEQIMILTWPQAVLAISFGVIYLMYGWRIFKALTVISFALLGLYAGMWVGAQFDKVLLGSLVGLTVLTILSVPLMKWAVCILGAVAGGILTAGIWYAFKLPEQFVWAGALVGFVAGGMSAFVVFRVSVMLFTSLGGGVLIIMGALALVWQYEGLQQPPTNRLSDIYFNNWFIPSLLIGATLFGMLLQWRFVKTSKNWTV